MRDNRDDGYDSDSRDDRDSRDVGRFSSLNRSEAETLSSVIIL